ncbi:Integrase catalytic core, partial [Trinorchestia longiramus]
PDHSLNCLSPANRVLVTCPLVAEATKVQEVFEIVRYSRLGKLLGVTARLFQVASKITKKPSSRREDQNKAKSYWIRHEQLTKMPDVYSFLQNEDFSKPVPPIVRDLNLFLDDGLIRSRGRLNKCKYLPYELSSPILLPRDSHFTRLIIQDCHEKCVHLGVASTVNALRNQGYWIPKARVLVKEVVRECMVCRKLNALPYKYPKVTDLCRDRVQFMKPYQNVGMDFTGHFQVKLGSTITKMYILLFTCLNVRAVHLELVPDMTTVAFLAAFVRFTNRYGVSSTLYSDNAPSFIQATEIINSCHNDVWGEHLARNNIKHYKIPVYSPWYGSICERVIGIVKKCLYKVIGK